MRTCSINGCNGEHVARGWCGMHYARWRTHGNPLKSNRGLISHGDRRKSSPHFYLYNLWHAVRSRCKPGGKDYKHYSSRGIRVYSLWERDYPAFKRWILENIGERPSPKHSIDRMDNDGNYEPGNLRWATQRVQVFNQRGRPVARSGYRYAYHIPNTPGKWVSVVAGEYLGTFPSPAKASAVGLARRTELENELKEIING